MLNIENFALLAYADADIIDVWRTQVINIKKTQEQDYKENKHTNTYTQNYTAPVGYNKAAYYTEAYGKTYQPHVNNAHVNYSKQTTNYSKTSYSYTKYTQTYNYLYNYTYNKYSKISPKHTKQFYHVKYVQRYNGHGQPHGSDVTTPTYKRTLYYTKVSPDYYQRYYYTQQATNYNKAYYYTKYTNSNTYTNKAYQQTAYGKSTHTNIATPHNNTAGYTHTNSVGYNKGFNHLNYIPTSPEIYDIDGNVLCGNITFDLASYDKNKDGFGTQDEKSKNIRYSLRIKRLQDAIGDAVTEDWQTLMTNSANDSHSVDFDSMPDGVYIAETKADNIPYTEKGVTETYESDWNSAYFTINNNIANITILNGPEFENYSFGFEQAVSKNKDIKDYVDNIMYANGDDLTKTGLFIEFNLDDLHENNYHTVKVYLTKADNELTKKYDAVLELDANGINPKKGDKNGVVFIPIEDMLTDGSYKDVDIKLEITEYVDKELTKQYGLMEREIGINDLSEVLYINLDNVYPTANATIPKPNYTSTQNVNMTFSDIGLGVLSAYYQFIDIDGEIDETKWNEVTETSINQIINIPGDWQLKLKVLDKAGNKTIETIGPYLIDDITAELEIPPAAYIGYDLPIDTIIHTKIPITGVESWMKDVTSPTTATEIDSNIDTNNGKYSLTFEVPLGTKLGTHVIFSKIYLSDGTDLTISQNIDISRFKQLKVDGLSVMHTTKWENNRLNYNSQVSASQQRPENMFWSGERLMFEVDGVGMLRVSAFIENTSFECGLVPTDTHTWKGTLWDENMKYKWGQEGNEPKRIVFILQDGTGKVFLKYVNIIFNDSEDYYQNHEND